MRCGTGWVGYAMCWLYIYRAQTRGPATSKRKQARKTGHALRKRWWQLNGARWPNLQKAAISIFSVGTSSCAAERPLLGWVFVRQRNGHRGRPPWCVNGAARRHNAPRFCVQKCWGPVYLPKKNTPHKKTHARPTLLPCPLAQKFFTHRKGSRKYGAPP